jgi:hypothetical protein
VAPLNKLRVSHLYHSVSGENDNGKEVQNWRKDVPRRVQNIKKTKNFKFCVHNAHMPFMIVKLLSYGSKTQTQTLI